MRRADDGTSALCLRIGMADAGTENAGIVAVALLDPAAEKMHDAVYEAP
jgi:hypothetical protein